MSNIKKFVIILTSIFLGSLLIAGVVFLFSGGFGPKNISDNRGILGINFGIVGSGFTIEEERDVAEFNSISTSSGINIILEQSDKQSVKIEAEENILPFIETNVRAGELIVKFSSGMLFMQTNKPVNCYISANDINSIKLSSSAALSCDDLNSDELSINMSSSASAQVNAEVKYLKINMSSSAILKISGEALKQDVSVSSSAKYLAEDLKSSECFVKSSSSAQAFINVSDELNAEASSSGQIKYTGSPNIISSISSAGSIINVK